MNRIFDNYFFGFSIIFSILIFFINAEANGFDKYSVQTNIDQIISTVDGGSGDLTIDFNPITESNDSNPISNTSNLSNGNGVASGGSGDLTFINHSNPSPMTYDSNSTSGTNTDINDTINDDDSSGCFLSTLFFT